MLPTLRDPWRISAQISSEHDAGVMSTLTSPALSQVSAAIDLYSGRQLLISDLGRTASVLEVPRTALSHLPFWPQQKILARRSHYKLTQQSLQQWVSMPKLTSAETAQRALAAHKIKQASRPRNGGVLAPMSLDLSGLDKLSCLPEGLTVGWELKLRGCARLQMLSANLHVGGNLDCCGCTHLAYVEDGLQVGGDASFDGCISLVGFANGTSIGGNLSLNDCTLLPNLPDRLTVGGSLQILRARKLRFLGKSMWVGRHIDLRYCDRLVTLPYDLTRIRGNLHLDECSDLQGFASELWVDGDFNCVACASLRTFSKFLHVRGNLNARRCIRLSHIGGHVRVGGHIDVSESMAFAGLPDDLTALFTQASATPHFLYVVGTALTARRVSALRLSNGTQVYLVWSLQDRVMATSNHALQCILSFWRGYRRSADTQYDELSRVTAWSLSATDAKTLRTFLLRLKDTADFAHRDGRSLLAQRVFRLLRAMDDGFELRTKCLSYMYEALASCEDRLTWVLGQIEQAVAVEDALGRAQSDEGLITLAKQYMRLEVVHKMAQKIVSAHPRADIIEVFLGLEMGVAAQVDLPVNHRGMLYAGMLKGIRINFLQLAQQAEAHAQDTASLKAFLEAWEPWRCHIRRKQALGVRHTRLPALLMPPDTSGTSICILTQELWEDLSEPVCSQTQHSQLLVYELRDLLVWWTNEGTDPMHRAPLALSDLRRVMRRPSNVAS